MSADLLLPPGFRFHPTDEELVMHYLCKKCSSQAISIPIIKEIDLYKYDPWQLPDMALYGEKEWYFFSPRDRKYPNGSRPNRAAGTGYWKATGADKPIGKTKKVGIKKALVFYAGKAPKGVKTNWIMHEYRLADVDRSIRKKNNSLRLDDWVLCRIYNKKGAGDICRSSSKPETTLTVSGHPPVTSESVRELVALGTDFVSSDRSDSVAYAPTDSNCSDRVISSNVTCDREVESHRTWSWEIKPTLDIPLNISNATGEDGFYQGFDSSSLSPGFKEILDIFKYI